MNRLYRLPVLLLAISGAACSVDTSVGAQQATETSTISGALTVSYQVLESESGWSGSTIDDVSELRIGPDFVVILRSNGDGLAFPAARVRELSWTAE